MAGVCGFAMSNGTGGGRGADTTSLSGVALLSLYLFFDSFQSQWQSGLFRKEKTSQLEMMRGVNAAASIFSVVSLVRERCSPVRAMILFPQLNALYHCAGLPLLGICPCCGTSGEYGWQASARELGPATTFIARNPECLVHIAGLAATGTVGQLFIYYTISNFGPVIFSMVRIPHKCTSSSSSCCRLIELPTAVSAQPNLFALSTELA